MTEASRKHIEYCHFVLLQVAGDKETTFSSAERLRIMAGRLNIEMAVGASAAAGSPTPETTGDEDDPELVLIAGGGVASKGSAAKHRMPQDKSRPFVPTIPLNHHRTNCIPGFRNHAWQNSGKCQRCGAMRPNG